MSDLIRGPRPTAACIAARLARVGAPLTDEQYRRLVRVVAEKESFDVVPMATAERDRRRRGRRERDTVQAAD